VADVDARSGDQLFHLPLRFAAEAAEKLLVAVGRTCHLPSGIASGLAWAHSRRCAAPAMELQPRAALALPYGEATRSPSIAKSSAARSGRFVHGATVLRR